MDKFINLFERKVISVVESSVKKTIALKLQEKQDLSIISTLSSLTTVVELSIKGDVDSRIMVALPLDLSLYLSSATKIDQRALKSLKNIVSMIFDTINKEFLNSKDTVNILFHIENILFIQKPISLDSFHKMYTYSFIIDDSMFSLMLIVDSNLLSLFESIDKDDCEFDEQLTLRVRIGKVMVPLNDVLNLGIGSVIELEHDINKPLDILMNNQIIAQGKIVMIDGKLGIEII